MGHKKWKVCKVLLLVPVLGALLLLSGQYIQQERENQSQIAIMKQQLATLENGEKQQQRNLARWYNYNLGLGMPGLAEAYGGILDFGNGVMATLEVPELNMQLPIFHGEAGIAGHLPESHFPIGGRGCHTVLTLKNWYPWKPGMAVYIDCLDQQTVYRVESVQVMKAGWPVDWPAEKERVTIVFEYGGLRTIVRCIRCGELNVRKMDAGTCYAAALAFGLLPAFFAKLLKNGYGAGVRKGKYPGFPRKNRRKTQLL